MKSIRVLLGLLAAASLSYAWAAAAADTTWAPTTTSLPQGSLPTDFQRDLAGVPDNVKTLIVTFEQIRETYLQRQYQLLAGLRSATTPDQVEQIREQLQDNRESFLADSKNYLQELRSDLQALKGKISQAEFLRVIDAAHSAAAGSGHRRRG